MSNLLKPFANFGYVDENLYILGLTQPIPEDFFDTVRAVSYDDLRLLGTVLKDWIEVKEILYLDHLFTFDHNLKLLKVEKIVKRQVYP